MKKSNFKKLFAVITLGLISASAYASPVPAACFKNSLKAVSKSVNLSEYDHEGFDVEDCALASNKAVWVCDVSASKGDGEAYDTFRVVLNKTCSKALRVKLISEE